MKQLLLVTMFAMFIGGCATLKPEPEYTGECKPWYPSTQRHFDAYECYGYERQRALLRELHNNE